MPRLIITFPPRHGKSELSSRRFPSWFVGRDPYRHLMVATYNQPFAEDFGRDVRSIMNSKAYQQIFPNVRFRKGSQAADRLQTEEEIGRAHVCTPVTHSHPVCRLLPEKTTPTIKNKNSIQ